MNYRMRILTIACLAALPGIHVESQNAVTFAQIEQLITAEKYDVAARLLEGLLKRIDSGKVSPQAKGRCQSLLTLVYSREGRTAELIDTLAAYQEYLRGINDLDGLREALIDSAAAHESLGDLGNAKLALEEALTNTGRIKLAPLADLTFRMANLSSQLGDVEKAKAEWLKSLDLTEQVIRRLGRQLSSRELDELRSRQIRCLKSLGNTNEAEANLKKLANDQKQRGDASKAAGTLIVLAEMLLEHDRTADAHRRLDDSQALVPESDATTRAEIRRVRAALLHADKQNQAALEESAAAAATYEQALGRGDLRRDELEYLERRLQSLYEQLGRSAEASKILKRRLERLPKAHPQQWLLRSDLAVLYATQGKHSEAIDLLSEVIAYRRTAQAINKSEIARLLNNRARVELASDRLDAAETSAKEAIQTIESVEDVASLKAEALCNLGSALYSKARYRDAIAKYREALDLLSGAEDEVRSLRSQVLLQIGLVYKSQGLYELAAESCETSVEIQKELVGESAFELTAYYRAIAALHIAGHRLDKTEAAAKEALEICRLHNKSADMVAGSAHHYVATVACARGNAERARAHWQEALAIFQEHQQQTMTAKTLNYLARLAQKEGKHEESESLYRKALTTLPEEGYPVTRFLALSNLAEACQAQGRLNEADVLLRQAVEVAEKPRAATWGADRERADFFAQFGSAFDQIVETAIKEGKLSEAIGYIERSRNRTFLDQLMNAGVDPRAKAPAALLEKEQRAAEKLKTFRTTVPPLEQRTLQEIEKLRNDLAAAQNEYEAAFTEILNASNSYQTLLAGNQDRDLAKNLDRQLTDSKGLVLLYFLGSKASYLFLVGKGLETPEVFPLTIPNDFALRIREMESTKDTSRGVGGIAVETVINYELSAGPLSRSQTAFIVSMLLHTLRAPRKHEGDPLQTISYTDVILPRVAIRRIEQLGPSWIAIVPDGALHGLPFEALEYLDGYLLDHLPPVTYAPSVSILSMLLNRTSKVQAPATELLLSVGDPEYPGETSRASEKPRPDTPPQMFVSLGGSLPRLSGSREECINVAKNFTERNVTLLLGSDATERRFRDKVHGVNFLHVAAHGLVNETEETLFNAIALSQSVSDSDLENDGMLTLSEIHLLDLAACELAVLSACQTNIGPERPFEAASSLARGFLAAGAKRVVSSHWEVNDVSTAKLIAAFFRELSTNRESAVPAAYAVALKSARLHVRNHPEWADPYFWAPFVLIGPPGE